jgi:flagellar hook-basal body complex protein FliE
MELDPVQFKTAAFAKPVFKIGAEFTEGAISEGSTPSAFSAALNHALTSLNDVQRTSRTSMEDFSAGGAIEVHEVMMGIEKADLSMNLALQVRNKVLEAYSDIIRMQI